MNSSKTPLSLARIASLLSLAFLTLTAKAHTVSADETNAADQKTLAIWQQPIEFYGKVADENSKPVPGATISFRWVEAPQKTGNRNLTTQSDAEGLFSLHGAKGPDLIVLVTKDGYYSSREHSGFKYGLFSVSNFTPNASSPVIFHLRKQGNGAQLITSDTGLRPSLAVRVPRDGTVVRVDLQGKQARTNGQLEISQIKPAWQEATEWSFRVSIPDGGLIENDQEFQFEAPETNYEPSLEFRFSKSTTNWVTQVTKQFYIAFGQPRKYGWVRIKSDLSQETVFLTYAYNPSGSRDLEPAESHAQAPAAQSSGPPGTKAAVPQFE
jgi:hypothetical protein